MRRIASRHNPIVARFRQAARGESDRVVLLDGVHLVSEALDAGLPIHEAAISADAERVAALHTLIVRLQAAGVEPVAVTPSVLAAISPVRSPSALVALADRPSQQDFVSSTRSPLLVVAVDVQDPGNLGAIVRVAEAGGANGIVVAGASADPFGWKALRGSMGSALRLPINVTRDTSSALSHLRSHHHCRIVATVPRGGQFIHDSNLTGPLAVLIGAEGSGLPDQVVADADQLVTITMKPPVESLNAAVTAALLVYEAQRQRQPHVRRPQAMAT
jgi:TrmH family RNA methyltransferase